LGGSFGDHHTECGALDYTLCLADEGDKLKKYLRDNINRYIKETVSNCFIKSSTEKNNKNIIIESCLRLEHMLIREEDIKILVALNNNKGFLLGNIFLLNIPESNYKNNSDFVIILEVNNTIGTYSILDLFIGFVLEYREIIAYLILLVLEIVCVMAELKSDFLEEIL
jgi:hypothetical protein